MSSARILAPPRTVDPYYHQAERMAELERRLLLLEGDRSRPNYIPVVTTLPDASTLPDGHEVYFAFSQTVNPTSAKKIKWHLRFDLADSAWYTVGDPEPIYAMQSATETFSSFSANAWGGVSSNDPTVTLPIPGEYRIEWGCGQFFLSSIGNWYIAAYFTTGEQTANGTQPTSDICAVSATGTWGSGQAVKKLTTSGANQVIRHRYYHTAAAAANLTRGSAFIKAFPRKFPV